MSTDSFSDLSAFVNFAECYLRDDGADLTPEECLALFRMQQASPNDVAAVREALDAMRRGDVGIALEEFDRRFREKNGIPSRA